MRNPKQEILTFSADLENIVLPAGSYFRMLFIEVDAPSDAGYVKVGLFERAKRADNSAPITSIDANQLVAMIQIKAAKETSEVVPYLSIPDLQLSKPLFLLNPVLVVKVSNVSAVVKVQVWYEPLN